MRAILISLTFHLQMICIIHFVFIPKQNFMFNVIIQINHDLELYLNNFMNNHIIANLVYWFADAPIFIIPLFLVITWIIYVNNKNEDSKNKLLFIFYSCVFAVILNIIVQHFIFLERPASYLQNAGHLILNHVPDASFPSDHSSVGIAFLTGLFLFGYETLGYFLILPIALMLLSRVIGGMHWPIDIIGGIVIGIISGFNIKYFSKNKYILKINDFIIKLMTYIKL